MTGGNGLSPADLPAWMGHVAAGVTVSANRHSGDGTGGTSTPGVVDFAAHQQLRDRVSTRLTAEGGASFEALDPSTQRLRKRTVAMEELQSWVVHRTSVGLAAPTLEDEDALVEAVLASLGGLGRLEPLLLRADVEDIFFHGTAPVMLRLQDGRKIQAGPIAGSNEELRNLLQALGTSLGDGTSREFSDARPLLALRLKASVTWGLGCPRRRM